MTVGILHWYVPDRTNRRTTRREVARGSRVINDGPRPKHAQLRDALAELAVGHGPDVAIPSERELMSTYGVSRATCRKGMDGLVSGGMLQRIHGKGTFVARPRVESRLPLASFSQDMRRRGF